MAHKRPTVEITGTKTVVDPRALTYLQNQGRGRVWRWSWYSGIDIIAVSDVLTMGRQEAIEKAASPVEGPEGLSKRADSIQGSMEPLLTT